jgi:hypothetical protein
LVKRYGLYLESNSTFFSQVFAGKDFNKASSFTRCLKDLSRKAENERKKLNLQDFCSIYSQVREACLKKERKKTRTVFDITILRILLFHSHSPAQCKGVHPSES